jgi:hypothetical protein
MQRRQRQSPRNRLEEEEGKRLIFELANQTTKKEVGKKVEFFVVCFKFLCKPDNKKRGGKKRRILLLFVSNSFANQTTKKEVGKKVEFFVVCFKFLCKPDNEKRGRKKDEVCCCLFQIPLQTLEIVFVVSPSKSTLFRHENVCVCFSSNPFFFSHQVKKKRPRRDEEDEEDEDADFDDVEDERSAAVPEPRVSRRLRAKQEEKAIEVSPAPPPVKRPTLSLVIPSAVLPKRPAPKQDPDDDVFLEFSDE